MRERLPLLPVSLAAPSSSSSKSVRARVLPGDSIIVVLTAQVLTLPLASRSISLELPLTAGDARGLAATRGDGRTLLAAAELALAAVSRLVTATGLAVLRGEAGMRAAAEGEEPLSPSNVNAAPLTEPLRMRTAGLETPEEARSFVVLYLLPLNEESTEIETPLALRYQATMTPRPTRPAANAPITIPVTWPPVSPALPPSPSPLGDEGGVVEGAKEADARETER